MNCLQIFVIARLDRGIQKIELDSPVKPENDSIEFLSFTPCALGAGFLTKCCFSDRTPVIIEYALSLPFRAVIRRLFGNNNIMHMAFS